MFFLSVYCNLSMVRYVSDDVGVMCHQGQLSEISEADDIYKHPFILIPKDCVWSVFSG